MLLKVQLNCVVFWRLLFGILTFSASYFVVFHHFSYLTNRICCIIVSVLTSIVVDRVFETRSDQKKDYKIGICRFSAKHTAPMSES